MKNLREEDMFAELKRRLEDYTEDPDSDTWNKIAGALPSDKAFSAGIVIDHITGGGIILLLLLQFLILDPVIKRDRLIVKSARTGISSPAPAPVGNHENEIPGERLSSTGLESVAERQDLMAPVQVDRAMSTTGDQHFAVTTRNNALLPGSYEEQLAAERTGEYVINDPVAGGAATKKNPVVDSVNNVHFDETVSLADVEICQDVPDSTVHATKTTSRPATHKKDQKTHLQAAFYGSITASFAYQNIVPFRNDDVSVNGLKSISIFDPTRIGIQLDAGYQRQLLKRLDAYAGIMYYRQHQRVAFYQSGETSVTSAGDLNFTLHPSDETREVNYFMQNIGVSAGFFYLIRDGKLQHKAGGGLQYQVGLANGDQTYNNRASTYVNYQLAYRLQVQMSEHADFFVQPSFNHVLHASEALHEPFGIKSYRAGIGFGLLWKLP